MHAPNLNALRVFDAAARWLNFRVAAEELLVTQGAVAQQIRRLEADLGLALFERQARGLTLTEAGRGLHGPVRQALELIGEALDKLQPEVRRITLSVTPSLAAKWLVARLGRFADSHPQIDLRIQASERRADFAGDGVDLAIRLGHPPFGAGLEPVLLAPLDLCAVCSPSMARGRVISGIADFAGERLVQDSHNYWERLFGAAGVPAKQRIQQFNQTGLAMDAAALGQGVALAPSLLILDDVRAGKLEVLWRDDADGEGGFYLVHPTNRRSNAALAIVSGWILREVAR